MYKPVCNFFVRCSSAITFALVMLSKGIYIWTLSKSSDVIPGGMRQNVSLANSPSYRENSDQVVKTHVWTGLCKDRRNTHTAALFFVLNYFFVFDYRLECNEWIFCLCIALSLEVFPYSSGSLLHSTNRALKIHFRFFLKSSLKTSGTFF